MKRLIILAALAAAAAIAVAGCGVDTSDVKPPPSSQGILGGHTTAPPSSAVSGTCELGWFGAGTGFYAGKAPDNQKAGGFQVTLTNNTSQPVQASWVTVIIDHNGKTVGSQTMQSDSSDTIRPHQSDSTWSTPFVPDEAEQHVSLKVMDETNGNIENKPGYSCTLSQWGNAT